MLRRAQGGKGGRLEEEDRGTFWRGTALDMDTRLRVGRAVAKTEGEAAEAMMGQLKRMAPEAPPALASDGKGSYREALVSAYGQVPPYCGRGRPPQKKQPLEGWQYLQVIKERSGGRVTAVRTQVVYGDPQHVKATLGEHTSYVERTQLTSRQMNGRLVRKTLSFSKQRSLLEAACAWEDALYNWVRPCKSLRVASREPHRRWDPRSPGMAAGLTDHLWSIEELLTIVVAPRPINT